MRGCISSEYHEPGATITTQVEPSPRPTSSISCRNERGATEPLDTDAVTAGESLHGGRIAHGLLVLSAPAVWAETAWAHDHRVQGLLGLTWGVSAVVQIGDTIHATASVEELADAGALRRLRHLKLQVPNQANKVAQRGTWKVLIKSQEEESSPPMCPTPDLCCLAG